MDEQKIKEFIFQAHQAGKSETSNLVKDVLLKTEGVVKDAVEKQLNGHLRDIKDHLKDQDVKLEEMNVKIEALAPVAETISVFGSIRKLLLWGTAPVIAIWGTIKFFK